MTRRLAALALGFSLAACRTGDGEAVSAVPPTPPAGPSAEVGFPDGSRLTVELAATPEDRERGLMFRQTMGPQDGMLFVFDADGGLSFWMKNTFVDLDMVWLDRAGKVTVLHANVPRSRPGMSDAEVATRSGHGLYVLELAAGQAAARKVTVGSVLKFALPGAPR